MHKIDHFCQNADHFSKYSDQTALKSGLFSNFVPAPFRISPKRSLITDYRDQSDLTTINKIYQSFRQQNILGVVLVPDTSNIQKFVKIFECFVVYIDIYLSASSLLGQSMYRSDRLNITDGSRSDGVGRGLGYGSILAKM